MSNNDLMLGMTQRTRVRAQVTYLMLKGAGYAAVAVVAIWIFVALVAWFGRTVLPDDAQLAADPAPQAFADMAERAAAEDAAANAARMAPAADAVVEEAPAADAVATEAAPAEDATTEAAPAADATAEEAPADGATVTE